MRNQALAAAWTMVRVAWQLVGLWWDTAVAVVKCERRRRGQR
jgi:hypothetical protein